MLIPQGTHCSDRKEGLSGQGDLDADAGPVAGANYAPSSTGKMGTEEQSQRAVVRKKSSDVCKAPGMVPSMQ